MPAGSIRKLPSGRWNLRAPGGNDPITGKRLIITETMPPGTSKRTAELRLGELANRRRARTSSTHTVQQVIDAYHDLTRLEKATRAKHTSVLKHLPTGFANRRADQLTRRDVNLLYKHLTDNGVGDSTIRALHGCLGAAFQQAVDEEWLNSNPFRKARVAKEPESRAGTVSVADRSLLTQAAAGRVAPVPLWLRVLMVTGARCSEVLAIRASSFNGDRLTIDGSIERGSERRRKAPKTDKRRTLTVDAETMGMVREWQQTQRAHALAAPGVTLARDPYLFAADLTGTTPWRADHKTFANLREAIAKADAALLRTADPALTKDNALEQAKAARPSLHATRQHDIRHAVASDLLATLDPVTVAYRLGDDPRTVLRVYAHVIEGRDREAADVMARRLS